MLEDAVKMAKVSVMLIVQTIFDIHEHISFATYPTILNSLSYIPSLTSLYNDSIKTISRKGWQFFSLLIFFPGGNLGSYTENKSLAISQSIQYFCYQRGGGTSRNTSINKTNKSHLASWITTKKDQKKTFHIWASTSEIFWFVHCHIILRPSQCFFLDCFT